MESKSKKSNKKGIMKSGLVYYTSLCRNSWISDTRKEIQRADKAEEYLSKYLKRKNRIGRMDQFSNEFANTK